MNAVFKKMQFKDQKIMLVLQEPSSFSGDADDMKAVAILHKEPVEGSSYDFVLVFVQKTEEIENWAPKLDSLLTEDGLFWWAYPKKSSKNYRSDISRDQGWQPLGDLGYEGVRQVAIDADWSALRFRKADHIKSLKRDPSWIMSKEGKKKAEK